MQFNLDARAWLADATGIPTTKLVCEQMKGSTSSSLFLVQRAGQENAPRFVLRVFDNRAWLEEEPDLVIHDAAALEEAQKTRVVAPKCLSFSETDVGFGAPVLLMSYVAGRIELKPADFGAWIDTQARTLAAIHRHKTKTFPWKYSTWVNQKQLRVPDSTTKPEVWRDAIAFWLEGAPDYDPVFIHRDYHPVNLLWQGEGISGVVDWVNACRGPSGIDVGHCRANLVQMFGLDAAEAFLLAYEQHVPAFEYNPYWAVDTVLDACLPAPSFYAPWQDFGLDMIAPEILQARIDDYLENVMNNV